MVAVAVAVIVIVAFSLRDEVQPGESCRHTSSELEGRETRVVPDWAMQGRTPCLLRWSMPGKAVIISIFSSFGAGQEGVRKGWDPELGHANQALHVLDPAIVLHPGYSTDSRRTERSFAHCAVHARSWNSGANAFDMAECTLDVILLAGLSPTKETATLFTLQPGL